MVIELGDCLDPPQRIFLVILIKTSYGRSHPFANTRQAGIRKYHADFAMTLLPLAVAPIAHSLASWCGHVGPPVTQTDCNAKQLPTRPARAR